LPDMIFGVPLCLRWFLGFSFSTVAMGSRSSSPFPGS
jgi:hypothetical protein